MHSPSEHRINNKTYDVEVHLVHTKAFPDQEDDFGVVGVFFDREAGGDIHNEFIASLDID